MGRMPPGAGAIENVHGPMTKLIYSSRVMRGRTMKCLVGSIDLPGFCKTRSISHQYHKLFIRTIISTIARTIVPAYFSVCLIGNIVACRGDPVQPSM